MDDFVKICQGNCYDNYVLRRDEMTANKLYGAVAAYAMIAILKFPDQVKRKKVEV